MTEKQKDSIIRKAVISATITSLIVVLGLVLLIAKEFIDAQYTTKVIILIVAIFLTIITYFSVCNWSVRAQKIKIKITKVRKKFIPGCFTKISPRKKELKEKEYFAILLKNGIVEIYTKNAYREYIFTEVLNLRKFVQKYKLVNEVVDLN